MNKEFKVNVQKFALLKANGEVLRNILLEIYRDGISMVQATAIVAEIEDIKMDVAREIITKSQLWESIGKRVNENTQEFMREAGDDEYDL